MNVLLATDGSKDAKAATAFLAEWPLPAETAVRVLATVTMPQSSLDIPTVRDFKEGLLAEARRVTEEARARLAGRWPAVRADVAEGNPKDLIVQTAEDWPAGLVVVGARGLGAVKAFLLGSVSSFVVRHAHCPVLVVKGQPRRLGSVVIAVDGSEDSLEAVRFVAGLPLGPKVKVRLVGVVEPVHYPTTAPALARAHLRAALAEMEGARRRELEKALERAGGGLKAIDRVTRSTPTGLPAETLARIAEEARADLLVVGARGLGGLKRMLLGSVSERVLRLAKCSVLVAKHGPRA
jgi:nucleotide-binding universal stress UspA family protein